MFGAPGLRIASPADCASKLVVGCAWGVSFKSGERGPVRNILAAFYGDTCSLMAREVFVCPSTARANRSSVVFMRSWDSDRASSYSSGKSGFFGQGSPISGSDTAHANASITGGWPH